MPEGKMSVEKRAFPRIAVKIPVKYRVVEEGKEAKDIQDWRRSELNAYTLDVSLGGLHLVLDQPLKVGEIMNLDLFLLDDKTKTLRVYAEVAWSNQDGAGLKFLMMKESDQRALKAFLDSPSK